MPINIDSTYFKAISQYFKEQKIRKKIGKNPEGERMCLYIYKLWGVGYMVEGRGVYFIPIKWGKIALFRRFLLVDGLCIDLH